MEIVNTFHYMQLCGAINALKLAGRTLPPTIYQDLRRLAAAGAPANENVQKLSRVFRSQCLDAGLVARGELFTDRECELIAD